MSLNTKAQQSSFVTVVAWIFIIISGLGSLISLLQDIIFHTVFNSPPLKQATHSGPVNTSPAFGFMFAHLQIILFSFLIISLITLIVSIGLLRRKNWARILFIVIMAVGITWNIASYAMQFFVFSMANGQVTGTPEMPDMHVFMIMIAVLSGLIAIGFSTLFAWIIRKLMSAAIIAEFTS